MTRWGIVAVLVATPVLAGCLDEPVDTEGATDQLNEQLAAIPLPTKLVWKKLADAPTPRAEHAAAVLDGKIYSIGGYYINNNQDGVALGPGALISLDSVDVYDIATDTWTTTTPYPVTLNHESAAGLDGFIYVFNGAASYKLDVAKAEWLPIAQPPGPAQTAALDPAVGKIYVGGSGGFAALYDPKTDTYVELPEYPDGRSHLASGVVFGKFYIGNGDKQGHSITTADLEQWDPAKQEWTRKTPNPVVRGSTVGTTWLNRFVVLGGQNQTTVATDPNSTDMIGFGEPSYDDVHAYDPLTDTWAELPAMPHGRHGFGAVTWEDKIYTLSGAPQEGVSGFAETLVLQAE